MLLRLCIWLCLVRWWAEYVIERCKKCDAEILVHTDSEENLVDIWSQAEEIEVQEQI